MGNKRIIYNEGDLVGKCIYISEEEPKLKKNGDYARQAKFKCICGNIYIADVSAVRSCRTFCGCTRGTATITHGYCMNGKGTREYRIWCAMKTRCYNPKVAYYKNYGGRGIKICDRWKDSFENFLADMGECPPNYSIERIKNDGNYEPGNCKWATRTEQSRNNRRNVFVEFNGERLTVADWDIKTNLPKGTINRRIFLLGWDVEKALTTPHLQPWRAKTGS